MSHHWPDDTRFTRIELEPEDRSCPSCGRYMHLCDHRHRKIFTMRGPVHIVSKLAHCPDKSCPGHRKTCAAEEEMGIAPPWWAIGWDVFAWIAEGRFARRWSVPRLRRELAEGHGITLSEDAIEKYVKRYKALTSTGGRPPAALARKYSGAEDLVMSIDGLQPEGTNQTLYVVSELGRKRVWFAEAVAQDDTGAVRALIERAREWARALGLSVRAWVSDGRDVFAESVADLFPGVTHRTCPSYFAEKLPRINADGRRWENNRLSPRRSISVHPRSSAVPVRRAAEAYAETDRSTDDCDDPYRGEHSYADAAISSDWDSGLAA